MTAPDPASTLRAAVARFALGAGVAVVTALTLLRDGADLVLLLASAVPFALLLAWLGWRARGLRRLWAVGIALLTPLAYYIAILVGFSVNDGSGLDSMIIVGLSGGGTGALLLWFWTLLAGGVPGSEDSAIWPAPLPVLVAGTALGGVLTPLATMLEPPGVGLALLHGVWQGAMMVTLLPPRRDANAPVQGLM